MGMHHWGLLVLVLVAGYALRSKWPLGLPVLG